MSELATTKTTDSKRGAFMQVLNDLIKNIISISDLSRGKASEIVQRVKDEKSHCIIMKNNKPEAVIVSVDEFSQTAEALKEYENLRNLLIDTYLLDLAEERMKSFNPSAAISSSDIINKYDLDVDRINKLSKLIEIE